MKLPLEYRWLKAHGFGGFPPWSLIDEPGQEGLRSEYMEETGEDFFPIARRQDCDDVAGFKVVSGELQREIVSVHLTWSGSREREGWPRKTTHVDMFDWLRNEVIPATQEWMSEDELVDLGDGC